MDLFRIVFNIVDTARVLHVPIDDSGRCYREEIAGSLVLIPRWKCGQFLSIAEFPAVLLTIRKLECDVGSGRGSLGGGGNRVTSEHYGSVRALLFHTLCVTPTQRRTHE